MFSFSTYMYVKIKIFIGTIVFGLLAALGVLCVKKENNPVIVKKTFYISFIGAVENKEPIKVRSGQNIKELLFKAILLTNADLSNINIFQKLFNNQVVLIPFLHGWPKLEPTKEVSVIQLTKRGLNKTMSKRIIRYLQTHKEVTWNDLDSIYGVGMSTLKILHTVFEIN